mmetsp:Transcript_18043/g.36205  ORF Transcript_18043/g.36205 Transcript_18043/m.36205 type:complete len:543 (-) Transcript_18043:54-1682(-)
MPDNTRIRHRGAASSNGGGSSSSFHYNKNNGITTTSLHQNNKNNSSMSEDNSNNDEFYDDDNATVTSSTSVYSNNSGSQMTSRSQKKSSANNMDHIDEEQGVVSKKRSSNNNNSVKKMKMHSSNTRRTTSHLDIDTSSAEINPLLSTTNNNSSATKKDNNKHNDKRSKTLFLKTAFWISAWYTTSLATLFLNKIILSRKGSSVHVLGMCQMTTAAVIGGWSSFGGLDWLKRVVLSVLRSFGVRVATVGSGGAESEKRGEQQDGNTTEQQQQQQAPLSPTPQNHPTFARDMSIVGLLRGLTVVLGLIALEHVPVSFVETIKATAPAFTVVFARLILKEHTPSPVMLTLVPVVAGLILCSKSELRFDTIGFLAAVTNNCADCVQNVMSKRMLAHMRPTQLQFYTSVAALVLQSPWVLKDVGHLIKSIGSSSGGSGGFDTDDEALYAALKGGTPVDSHDGTEMALWKLLLIDAIFYHLQSVSAYCTMGCMSPVSQSVANTLKRALLVWASILYFHNPITNSGILGILMVVSGVFLYNHVRRIHQS